MVLPSDGYHQKQELEFGASSQKIPEGFPYKPFTSCKTSNEAYISWASSGLTVNTDPQVPSPWSTPFPQKVCWNLLLAYMEPCTLTS